MKYLFFILLILNTHSAFSQKITSKEKGGKYALFLDDEKITSYQYDEVLKANRGFLAVAINQKWGLVNARGETILVCKFDTVMCTYGYVIIVAKDKRFGAVDTLGQELMPIEYQVIDHALTNGEGVVKKDDKWAYRNSDGTLDYSSEKLVFTMPTKLARFKKCPKHKKDYKAAKQCADGELLKFIYNNVKYPTLARENGVQGMAVVSFVVTAKGKVTNAQILRDPGSGCGRESKRVVELMKDKWIPAEQDGKKVACRYHLPIRFKLN